MTNETANKSGSGNINPIRKIQSLVKNEPKVIVEQIDEVVNLVSDSNFNSTGTASKEAKNLGPKLKINIGTEKRHMLAHGQGAFKPPNILMRKLALKLVSNFDTLGPQ